MKEKIEAIVKDLEERYDYYLEKSEDIMYINTWNVIEQRIHDIKIEINTYKKILEMLEK